MKSNVLRKICLSMVMLFTLLSFGTYAQADTWTQMYGNVANIARSFGSMAYGNGTYVATTGFASNNTPSSGTFNYTQRVYTSSDLANWTEQDPVMTYSHAGTSGSFSYGVTFVNNTFVLWALCWDSTSTVTNSGIYMSSNGISWTQTYSGADSYLGFGSGVNQFFSPQVVKNYDSSSNTTALTYRIRSSLDGNAWTERYTNTFSGPGNALNGSGSVTFSYNTFVARFNFTNSSTSPATYTSKLFFSSDGITWTERYAGNGTLSYTRLKNTLVIALQTNNGGSPATATTRILTSDDDGYTWTERYNQTFIGSVSSNVSSNNNDALVAWIGINNNGQYNMKMLYSADGSTWAETYDQTFIGSGSYQGGYYRSPFGTRININNSGQYTTKILQAPKGDAWTETYSNIFTTNVGLSLASWNGNLIAFGSDGNGHAMVLQNTSPIALWISSIVRDSNSNPISGATASIAGNSSLTATTSSNGWFTLRGIPSATPYTLKVVKKGYRPTYVMLYVYLPPNPWDFTMSLTSASPVWLYSNVEVNRWRVAPNKGVLVIRIVDGFTAYSGNIPGVVVTATGSHSGKDYPVTYLDSLGDISTGATSTSSRGAIRVLNVDDGDTVTLTASKQGWNFFPQSFVAYGGGVTAGVVSGTPTGSMYSISGIVKDSSGNLPISAAYVSVTDVNTATEVAKARTIESGYYRIDLPSSGSYSVSVMRTGYDSMSQPAMVSLSDTSPNDTLNLFMIQNPFAGHGQKDHKKTHGHGQKDHKKTHGHAPVSGHHPGYTAP
ncbi:MAG: carboxypeptidase-like regulatory domain-containing protein [Proteobacteria bacterium]|nr:carboxypeptidase-like regulatory domain-containing protein [Pseudomonadota bacterium]